MTQHQRGKEILRRLKKTYQHRGEFVQWSNPLELLIGTILSAQCTDKRVNIVTKKLFKKYRTARAYARADLKTLERQIFSTGFYKSKARYLKGTGARLVEQYGGEVPNSFDDLITLPGVSDKTAHLIMAKVFHTPTGVAVDTHVQRLAPRLGLTRHTQPKKIGQDLDRLFVSRDYLDVNEYFIMHGRALCVRLPKCTQCPLIDICPTGKKNTAQRAVRNVAKRRG